MSDGTFHELNTGDVTDDDWEVFDDALQQSPLPPEPAADTPVVNKAVEPPRPTRVIGSSYFNIAGGSTIPFQVVWPDPNRVELHIRVRNIDPALYAAARFTNDRTDSPTISGFSIDNYDGDVAITGHTGTLWCLANLDTVVNVYAVTK